LGVNFKLIDYLKKEIHNIYFLKKYNEEGFVFFTNYNSEKGKAILTNPHVCLSFFWTSMERQVIIKGIVEKTTDIVSDNYFDSRPDGSKLGALVSAQSEVIPNREFLETQLKALEEKFEGKQIPRPEYWGGFIIKPIEVEFWQGRPNRLHDRIVYKLSENYDWNISRLSP
jgi:pyridoxamine 5'-phosphate oxidase